MNSATIEIGNYSREHGLQLTWVDGFTIDVKFHGGEVVLRADPAGLRSLAAHLLTLAANEVPDGAHIHLEAGLELEDGSASLVVERATF